MLLAIIISDSVLEYLQVRFHRGVSDQCPIGSTYWVIAWDTHYNIRTLYLKHFH